MKKHLLLSAFSFFFLQNINAQQYYPLLDSANRWIYTQTFMTPIIEPNNYILSALCPYPAPCFGSAEQFTGVNVTINNNTYKTLLDGAFGNCVFGYIREDTAQRKVYFQRNDTSYSEILLYDFSMQVGDTFNVNFYSSGYFQNGDYILASITNVTIAAGVRREFQLNHTGSGPPLIWIESVGNRGHAIYPFCGNSAAFGPVIFSNCTGFPYTFCQILTCFLHTQKVFYDVCAHQMASSGSQCIGYSDSCHYFNTCVSVEELNSFFSFSVSPNPSSGIFIVTSQEEIESIEIYNVLGETIYKTEKRDVKQEIDLSAQAKGIYFVKIVSGDKTASQKIIVE